MGPVIKSILDQEERDKTPNVLVAFEPERDVFRVEYSDLQGNRHIFLVMTKSDRASPENQNPTFYTQISCCVGKYNPSDPCEPKYGHWGYILLRPEGMDTMSLQSELLPVAILMRLASAIDFYFSWFDDESRDVRNVPFVGNPPREVSGRKEKYSVIQYFRDELQHALNKISA